MGCMAALEAEKFLSHDWLYSNKFDLE
jgi:hypothetical protein